jgi:6-pyruvoyltetrahydropterin/6-carboxytetrahydropterin synthase
MQYIITKDLEFSYGHRVWSQTLNGEYSNNLKTACRHLHGHEARVSISLSAPALTCGMVTDFRHLEWLKTFLNTFVDHQFIIDRNDPLYSRLLGNVKLEPVQVPGRDLVAGYIVSADSYSELTACEQEMLEGFFVVDFVPTSENLSSWLARIVTDKMQNLGVSVQSVTWWETPRSRSQFVA